MMKLMCRKKYRPLELIKAYNEDSAMRSYFNDNKAFYLQKRAL